MGIKGRWPLWAGITAPHCFVAAQKVSCSKPHVRKYKMILSQAFSKKTDSVYASLALIAVHSLWQIAASKAD